jgi:hypothetical protein
MTMDACILRGVCTRLVAAAAAKTAIETVLDDLGKTGPCQCEGYPEREGGVAGSPLPGIKGLGMRRPNGGRLQILHGCVQRSYAPHPWDRESGRSCRRVFTTVGHPSAALPIVPDFSGLVASV